MRLTFLLLGVALASPAFAQTPPQPGQAMPGMSNMTQPSNSGSTAAYQAAMAKMHAAMDIPYSGNPDQDFVAGMIPHHQGAIDMARVELQYGHDPRLRRLAREIVTAQQREIAVMRRWQAAHPK